MQLYRLIFDHSLEGYRRKITHETWVALPCNNHKRGQGSADWSQQTHVLLFCLDHNTCVTTCAINVLLLIHCDYSFLPVKYLRNGTYFPAYRWNSLLIKMSQHIPITREWCKTDPLTLDSYSKFIINVLTFFSFSYQL